MSAAYSMTIGGTKTWLYHPDLMGMDCSSRLGLARSFHCVGGRLDPLESFVKTVPSTFRFCVIVK